MTELKRGQGGGDVVVRIGLDVSAEEADFFQRYADYRNATAKIQGITLRRLWTRKTIMESLLSGAAHQQRAQLRKMFEACGPFPPEKDEEAMKRYAQKVLAWSASIDAAEKAQSTE